MTFLNETIVVSIEEKESRDLVSNTVQEEGNARHKTKEEIEEEENVIAGTKAFRVTVSVNGSTKTFFSPLARDIPEERAAALSYCFLEISQSLVNQFSKDPDKISLIIGG